MVRETKTLTPSPGGVRSPDAPPSSDGEEPVGPLAAGTCVGRYTIRGLVGEGGMGRVYAAEDPQLERTVALKLLRADAGSASRARRTRFLREAQAMARLVHPNVVSVFDVGTHEDQVFVAMELVDGETLAAWLARTPRRWREVRDAFLAAGRGLVAAHEAGIVHRDFKPHNVLVGGGRIVVADFGLARAGAEPDELLGGEASSLLALGVTATGAVVGTPGYVAPEVVAGQPATARSDQYSYCVALDEALRGTGARVPRFLAAAVRRGLAPDPAARHASMRALLAVAARDPARAARRVALAVAVAAVVGVGGYLAADRVAARSAQACAGEGHLGGVWDPGRRAEVERAFGAAGVAYASPAFAGVAPVLDGYAGAWTAARVAACRASRVTGGQSERLLALRVECLERRREALRALTDALAGPLTGTELAQARPAAERLPRIEDCADVARLEEAAPLPAAESERTRVRQGLADMASVDVMYKLGRYDAARATLARVETAVRDLAYAPLGSDVRFWRGWFAYRDGPETEAEPLLHESLRLAVEARDVPREARGWRGLFMVLATYPPRVAEAEQVRRVAELSVERAGRPPGEATLVQTSVVRMYMNAGRLLEAEAQARSLLGALPRSDVWNRAAALELHARVLASLGRDVEAARVAVEAVAAWTELLGPESPKQVAALNALAAAYDHLDRFAEADATLQKALRLQLADHDAARRDLWNTVQRLAWVAAGRHDQAATRIWVAWLLALHADGVDEVNARNALAQAGGALTKVGLPAEGVVYLRSSLAQSLARKDVHRAGIASLYLGDTLLALGQPAEALERCTYTETHIADSVGAGRLTDILKCRGDALVALGRAAEAVPLLERAAALSAGDDSTAADRAEVQAALDRALAARDKTARR